MEKNTEWQKLQDVHEKAKKASVSYSLHYAEVDDAWSFSVYSCAPAEEWEGKNYSFDIAVQCVMEWLDSLLGDGLIVHDDVLHPDEMNFDDEDKPQ